MDIQTETTPIVPGEIQLTPDELLAGQIREHHQDELEIPPNRSEKELLWLMEYVRNGYHAREAARVVGYTSHNATLGWVKPRREDSQKPDFWDIVKKTQGRRSTYLDATRERVMTEYTRIAFFDPLDMFDDEGRLLPLSEMPEDARRAIAGFDVNVTPAGEIVTKIKFNSKNVALKDLSTILGINKETIIHEHKFADLLREIQQVEAEPLVAIEEALVVDE